MCSIDYNIIAPRWCHSEDKNCQNGQWVRTIFYSVKSSPTANEVKKLVGVWPAFQILSSLHFDCKTFRLSRFMTLGIFCGQLLDKMFVGLHEILHKENCASCHACCIVQLANITNIILVNKWSNIYYHSWHNASPSSFINLKIMISVWVSFVNFHNLRCAPES